VRSHDHEDDERIPLGVESVVPQLRPEGIEMTEPDFEQIAWAVKNTVDDHPSLSQQNMRLIADALRQVWNARGTADLAALANTMRGDPDISAMRAIKALDR
jgi:hypothetical protein